MRPAWRATRPWSNPSLNPLPFFPACEFRACWVWPLRLLFVCAGAKTMGRRPLAFAGATTAENKKHLLWLCLWGPAAGRRVLTSVLTLGPPHNPSRRAGAGRRQPFINNVSRPARASRPRSNTWMTPSFGSLRPRPRSHRQGRAAVRSSFLSSRMIRLYVAGSPTNFMVLTRATNPPGADGILSTADDIHDATNFVTPLVDQSC